VSEELALSEVSERLAAMGEYDARGVEVVTDFGRDNAAHSWLSVPSPELPPSSTRSISFEAVRTNARYVSPVTTKMSV